MKEKDSSITRRNTKKILNNSYKNGDNLKATEEYEFTRALVVDSVGAETYMKIDYDYDSILYEDMVTYANELIDSNEFLKNLLSMDLLSPEDADKRKFTSDELNKAFYIIEEHLENKNMEFFKISYAFQIICNLFSISHAILFDILDYENKKAVLIGLSKETGLDITRHEFN